MDNYMKMEIAALGENESFARSAVAAFALPLNPSFTELSDIKTAVSEAVTNAIVHAYNHGKTEGKIVIECSLQRSKNRQSDFFKDEYSALHIRISDFGCGIENVEQALIPFFTTLIEEERSGMGFTIMQTFMDEFSLQSEKGKGTVIEMVKKIGFAENAECKERANA